MMKLFAPLLLVAWTTPAVLGQTCGLCPGGFGPRREAAEYGDYQGQIVDCGMLHLLLQNVPDPECEAAQDAALLNPYPAQCGYCLVPENATDLCQLCEDGSSPGRTPSYMLLDGEDCGTKHYLALREAPGSPECAAIQAFGFECGCPTLPPSTVAPATGAPVTAVPAPTTPTVVPSTTDAPAVPTTEAPVTPTVPTTEAPVTPTVPTTEAPVAPGTEAPVTSAPATEAPASLAPVTEVPVAPTEAPVPPPTLAPTTSGSSFAKYVGSAMLAIAAYVMMA